jgi:hypothetical protein
VEDLLFATLDPLTRRIVLPGRSRVLLTDTVGFIQKLPTQLVAAFRATLEELSEADLLLHVVDITHPNAAEQAEAVERTLSELEVAGKPRLTLLNKVDRLTRRDGRPAGLEDLGSTAIAERDRPDACSSPRSGAGWMTCWPHRGHLRGRGDRRVEETARQVERNIGSWNSGHEPGAVQRSTVPTFEMKNEVAVVRHRLWPALDELDAGSFLVPGIDSELICRTFL